MTTPNSALELGTNMDAPEPALSGSKGSSPLGTWDTSNLSSPKSNGCAIHSTAARSEDVEWVRNHDRPSRKKVIPPSEQGYILLFAIFLTALLVIALAIAAPKVAKSIQRDKELETFNRGLQYRRAIQLYYRKFNAYPPSLDALVQTNNIRFLRKKYIDPMTGKDDWKPILFGQNKAPTAMGFFGQPLAGGATTIAGIGPGGGNTPGGTGGSILPGGMGFLTGGSPTDTSSTTSSGSPGDPNNPNAGSTGSPDSPSGTSTSGGPGSSTSSGQSGQSGQTFGGGGIIGVRLPLEKKSILVYKKKNHYNEWEFTYDPISDQQMMGGAGGGANPLNQPNGTNSSGIGGSNGIGGNNGIGGYNGTGGNNGSGGSSGLSGTSNSTPQSSTPQQ